MEAIQNAASGLLVNAALGVLSLLAALAMYYLNLAASRVKEQTAKIRDERTRTLAENAVADVVDLATVTVGAMEQTTAKALREAVKAGTAEREQLLALGQQVFDEVKAAVAPEAQAAIGKNLGDFDTYLKNVIENAVRQVKEETPYITLAEPVTEEAGAEEGQ